MSLAENVAPMPERNPVEKSIRAVLDRPMAAHIKEGPAPAERRIDWLDRCVDLLVSHTFPMSRIQDAFECSISRESAKIILDPWA